MTIILFEDKKWSRFLPLVYTRPVGDLRMGILKISDKYQRIFQVPVSHESRVYLKSIFPMVIDDDPLLINARLIPDQDVIRAIKALNVNEALMHQGVMLAVRSQLPDRHDANKLDYEGTPILLEQITDLFALNHVAMALDFDEMVKNRSSESMHSSSVLIGPQERLFIEPGAKVFASTINTLEGAVYIGKDAEVMEGSHIRGPFSLGDHSTLKMGAKIYGATTIGPYSKVGGEVSNSIIQGYSNKGHDGFIGNSILGEWCNLGADTNTSNLKNNYGKVKIWNYESNRYAETGLTFCGLIMGDHSKCGINTMFNTGTVVGVSANIFGGSFPAKHIPSFAWGGGDSFIEYELPKALETATRVLERRSLVLSADIAQMLTEVFRNTLSQR